MGDPQNLAFPDNFSHLITKKLWSSKSTFIFSGITVYSRITGWKFSDICWPDHNFNDFRYPKIWKITLLNKPSSAMNPIGMLHCTAIFQTGTLWQFCLIIFNHIF